MPKLPRIRASQAEKLLLEAGFTLMRSKGSHRIYFKGNTRVVIPFHGGKILHPKIIKQVFQAIELTEYPQEIIGEEEKRDRPISDRLSSLTEDSYSDNLSPEIPVQPLNKEVRSDRGASDEDINDDEQYKEPINK